VAAIVLEGFTRPSFELFGSALDRFVMFKMSYCWLWHPLGEFTVIVDEIILYRFCFQSDEGYLAHHARLQCFYLISLSGCDATVVTLLFESEEVERSSGCYGPMLIIQTSGVNLISCLLVLVILNTNVIY